MTQDADELSRDERIDLIQWSFASGVWTLEKALDALCATEPTLRREDLQAVLLRVCPLPPGCRNYVRHRDIKLDYALEGFPALPSIAAVIRDAERMLSQETAG